MDIIEQITKLIIMIVTHQLTNILPVRFFRDGILQLQAEGAHVSENKDDPVVRHRVKSDLDSWEMMTLIFVAGKSSAKTCTTDPPDPSLTFKSFLPNRLTSFDLQRPDCPFQLLWILGH